MALLVRRHTETEVLCGPEGFLLMDHRTGKCLLMGGEERYLLHLLENTESISDACSAFQSRFNKSVTPRQIEEFIEQVSQHGMLADYTPERSGQKSDTVEEVAIVEDPFSLSAPQAKTNFVFDLLVLLFGWILHPINILPILALMWMASNVLLEQGNELLYEHFLVLGQYHIAFSLLFILVPKHFLLSCVEATLTGMACRRFGGRIRKAGIRLRLGLLPALQAEYDDSILMLPLRGRRTFMCVGIWSVLGIGSLAIIITSLTPAQSALHKICILLILPCLVRLTIVCNIFFRYSGLYLLLADNLGERNLIEDAVDEAGRWLTFGPPAQQMSDRRRFWLRLYGTGYFVYRMVLSILILWAGWYVSVNGMGLLGALLTIAVFVYCNKDLIFRNKSISVKKRPPELAPAASSVT